MNDWLIFLATLGVQLLMGAYVYGKLSRSVDSHDKSIDGLWSRVNDHGERISRIEGRDR